MTRYMSLLTLTLLLSRPASAHADPITINFEGLDDLASIGALFPGLTFSNATILTASLSLNEFEFPPRSGSNVAFDDGGAMRIDFLAPVSAFGGYFTYLSPIVLTAHDAAGNILGSSSSAFLVNLALSGDPGSASNEFLSLAFNNISYVTIVGDALGGSFTLDDLVFDTAAASVPEPGTLALVALGGGALMGRRRKRAGTV
jgi:PEP-CTERM motif